MRRAPPAGSFGIDKEVAVTMGRRFVLGSGVAVASVMLVSGCATPIGGYAEADAGRVVIGIGAAAGTTNFQFFLNYRRMGTDSAGMFTYVQNHLTIKRDYDNAGENGVIVTTTLQPGDYEINGFRAARFVGMSQTQFSPRQPFSVRFTIRPGQTTYLGNWQAHHVTRPALLGLVNNDVAVAFVVSNRQRDDLALLARREPALQLGPVINATPDPRTVGHPLIRDRAP